MDKDEMDQVIDEIDTIAPGLRRNRRLAALVALDP
jgi:hypothetical protein